MYTSTLSSSQVLAESLNRLASRTFTPTYRLVLSHMAPNVTVLLGAPMVVLPAVVARFQPVSFRLPSMAGALLTLLASTVPATAPATLKGLSKLSIDRMQTTACHCRGSFNIGIIIISP